MKKGVWLIHRRYPHLATRTAVAPSVVHYSRLPIMAFTVRIPSAANMTGLPLPINGNRLHSLFFRSRIGGPGCSYGFTGPSQMYPKCAVPSLGDPVFLLPDPRCSLLFMARSHVLAALYRPTLGDPR